MANKFSARYEYAISWALWFSFMSVLLFSPLPDYGNYGPEAITDKLAHAFLFAVFSFLGARFFRACRSGLAIASLLGFILALLYAYAAEIVQTYVPGRDRSTLDFLSGAFGAALAMYAFFYREKQRGPKLLLHICCAACGAYVAKLLADEGNTVTLYYYNPNIDTAEEYEKRSVEVRKIADKYGYRFIIDSYDHQAWLTKIAGKESDPERGLRCITCYSDRLEKTAKLCKDGDFDLFTSTLSVSPHKDAVLLSHIGKTVAAKYDVAYLDRDFKADKGFQRSVALSKELGLYRQDYCGCEFSRRQPSDNNKSGA